MSKDLPIADIRSGLDGAAQDNVYYQWLLDACDIIEELRAENKKLKEARAGQMAIKFSESEASTSI